MFDVGSGATLRNVVLLIVKAPVTGSCSPTISVAIASKSWR
jgi:hypothetical protein